MRCRSCECNTVLRRIRVGNGLAHSASKSFICTKIHIVGAGIARPFLWLSAQSSVGLLQEMYRHNFDTQLKNDPLRQLRCQLPLRRGANGVRQAHGFLRIFDTGLTQRTYRYGVRAPPKKPPLCKGRRVGFSRAGGVVFSVANCRTYGYGNYRCPVSKQRNTPYCFAFRLCGADLQRTPIAISHRLSAIYSLRFTPMFRTGPPQ